MLGGSLSRQGELAQGAAGRDTYCAAIDWARQAVAYQIFVDRFAQANPDNDAVHCPSCDAEPNSNSFVGGNLRGISERLGYLEDLGVDLIYLTPIFEAASNHRYDVTDYYRTDPRLGTMEDLRHLVERAHDRGMRVVLDGVFNHCGRGFFAFADVLENGPDSPYRDWFYVDAFPLESDGKHHFKAWQDAPCLPELNLGNPQTRAYLLRAAELWTGQGLDGWRCDAVRHVRYREFWPELKRVVRNVNPRAYLLAEIWEDPGEWLDAGYFDGATQYAFRDLALEFLVERSIRPTELARGLERLTRRHPRATTLAMSNLIGSHDTPRIWSLTKGDLAVTKLAFLLQFSFPGIPAIYYGDEIGLEGRMEADNRRAMEWDPGRWNQELRSFVQQLIGLRRSMRPLQYGDWQTLLTDDERQICVFLRSFEGQHVIILLNNGPLREVIRLDLRPWSLPPANTYLDILSGQELEGEGGFLEVQDLPTRSGLLLATRSSAGFCR